MCVCIPLSVSVSMEILSYRAVRILKFILSSLPALQSSTPLHSLSQEHEQEPKDNCCCKDLVLHRVGIVSGTVETV